MANVLFTFEAKERVWRALCFLILSVSTSVGAQLPGNVRDSAGRPVIIFIHGRNQGLIVGAVRDSYWTGALQDGLEKFGGLSALTSDDVLFVNYSGVFEPEPVSSSRCGTPATLSDQPGLPLTDVTMGPRPLTGVAQLLRKLQPRRWLTFLLPTMEDVELYLTDRSTTCAVNQRVWAILDSAAAMRRPVIIVAHSLGGLVAVGALSERDRFHITVPRVHALISIGSQLGLEGLANRLPFSTEKSQVFPPLTDRWLNFWSDADPLAFQVRDSKFLENHKDDFWEEQVITDAEDPHNAIGYLKHPVVAGAVLEEWCAAFEPPATPPIVCNNEPWNRIAHSSHVQPSRIKFGIQGGYYVWNSGYAERETVSLWPSLGFRVSTPPLASILTEFSVTTFTYRSKINTTFGHDWTVRRRLRGSDDANISAVFGRSTLRYRSGRSPIDGTILRAFRFQGFGFQASASLPFLWNPPQSIGSHIFIAVTKQHVLSGPRELLFSRSFHRMESGFDIDFRALLDRFRGEPKSADCGCK